MANINIEILSVGNPKHVPVAGKAGYYALEVAYKDKGKVGGRKFVSFKEPQVFESLKELSQGDFADVVMEKEPGSDGREYWVWKQVTKVAAPNEGTTAPAAEVSSPAENTGVTQTTPRGGKVIGSTYETPAERARKQVFIVRQSSVDRAADYLEGTDPSLEEIFEVATKIEGHIFNGYEKIYEEAGIEKETSKSKETSGEANVVAASQNGSEQASVLTKPRRGRPPKVAEIDPTDDIPF